LLYVYIGGGVGAGIVINDTILRGSRGGAGEFGHTSVNRNGIRCECGNVGCLENYVNWPAIRNRWYAEASMDQRTRLLELAKGDITTISPDHFSAALKEEDSVALAVMEDTVSLLGAGVVNMVNLFNPDVVILGGNVLYGNELMMNSLKAYIQQHALGFSTSSLEICSGSLGENAELIGAASILLQDVFQFTLS
jgi:N-acetylglucosamine repressor